jgi:phosphoglycerate dehydrogenase-like enzyme
VSTVAILQDLGIGRDEVEDLAARRLPGWSVGWAAGPGPVEARAAGAEVIVTVNEPVGGAALEALGPRLVAVSFTGTDHVDLAAARRLGVAVTNVPAYATSSVAELTVGMIIALLRRIVDCDRSVRAGTWREGLAGVELEGKTVGIVGTGRTGTAVARRLAPFGCRLVGFSRSVTDAFVEAGGTALELDALLSSSDVVTLHVPLTDATRGLVGERELGLMRPTAVLVNTARGPVVDTAALARALEEGRIAGAAVDVYDVEPVAPDCPLVRAPRTLLMPHVAFATGEALARRAAITIDCIRAFLDGVPLNRIA